MPTAANIHALLRAYRFNSYDEYDLQRGIEQVLTSGGMTFDREFHLDRHNRIDFLVGDVGIEVKVDGSLTAVTRQVFRYLGFERLGSVIIVTTRQKHRGLPVEMRGKKVYVLALLSGIM